MFVHLFTVILLISNFSRIEANSEPEQERIINNLEIIYGNQGVAVKFWYNETKTVSNQLVSVPGCPKSIEGIPWIYYGKPPRCFLAGHHGPCPLGQKLLVKKGSPFGVCVCECVVDGIQKRSLEWDKLKNSRYVMCEGHGENANPFGQIFDTKTNECYEKATQGPCPKGKLLVSSTSEDLECLPICGGKEGEWKVMYGDYCRMILGGYNIAADLEENKCSSSQKYSEKLKKCVEDHTFVLA